jgi:hypothetical protein
LARRPIDLSPQARALISQVRALHEQLTGARREFAADLANVRAEVEKEVARIERARWEAAPVGSPERQASRLASETDRLIAQQAQLAAEANRLRSEVDRLAAERDQLLAIATAGTGSSPNAERLAAGERCALTADLEQLRAQRARLGDELERLAADRERLAEERDALIGETERKLNAERQRMVIELDKVRIGHQADANAERELNRGEAAAARAELDRDRAALSAASAGRRHELAELIGQAWDEYERVRADAQADALHFKDRPAVKAAEAVQAKGHELARARRAAKRAEWVVAFYEQQFPWLAELRDLEAEQDYVEGEPELVEEATSDDGSKRDPAQQWLSKEEYGALSDAERNQRALERYLASRKTPWQVGRDYERYIGYQRELAGAQVTYQGIFAGLEDLGRDLICETADGIEVVQCKRWAKRKTIHEKHIFQLFGTVVAMRIEHPDRTVTGTFTTTTTLSGRAHQFADQLGIRVEQDVPLADYPRIKCNVGREGQRIYHLPFDQQYDTTVIEPAKGERWVATVAEAEALGFRRAWRWKGAAAPAAT